MVAVRDGEAGRPLRALRAGQFYTQAGVLGGREGIRKQTR